MELKKKTIIGEENNEPPKDYIGVKSDGKAYEFDHNDRRGKESQIVSNTNASDGGTGLTGNLLDDWVTAVTQGEYTKYEDIPMGVIGENDGWKRKPKDSTIIGYTADSSIEDDTIEVHIYKDLQLEWNIKQKQ